MPLPDHLALRSQLRESLAEIGAELCSVAATLRAEADVVNPSPHADARAGAQILEELADDVEALVADPSKNVPGWQWTMEQVEVAACAVEMAIEPGSALL